MNLQEYAAAAKSGRIIALNGKVNHEMVKALRLQVKELLEKNITGPYVLTLTTPGGDIEQAFVLYHDLVTLDAMAKLTIVCQSNVTSAGIDIILAVPTERRFAFPFTKFYPHRVAFTWKTELDATVEEHAYTLKEYEAQINHTRKLEETLLSLAAESTGKDERWWREIWDQPRVIYTDEAIEIGLIKGLIE
jgi:ATP-dependent protease ClpP protease subunit